MIRVMTLPQHTAAKTLGVSLSTLKRRFYEIGLGRWPGNLIDKKNRDSCSEEDDAASCKEMTITPEKKTCISFLVNKTNQDERYLDGVTMMVLHASFNQEV